MRDQDSVGNRTWTVAEAKMRLSEVLRQAEREGPQRIGIRKPFVVVSEADWRRQTPERMPFGRWLVANLPRGIELETPDRSEPDRQVPSLLP